MYQLSVAALKSYPRMERLPTTHICGLTVWLRNLGVAQLSASDSESLTSHRPNVSPAAVISRLSSGETYQVGSWWKTWKIHCQTHSCGHWQVSRPGWLLARDMRSLPHGPLVWATHNMCLLPQSQGSEREKGCKSQSLWNLILEMTCIRVIIFCLFCYLEVSSQIQPTIKEIT